MAALSPLERQAVGAAYYGDRTYREVAQALGVPLGTIKVPHPIGADLRFHAQDEAA